MLDLLPQEEDSVFGVKKSSRFGNMIFYEASWAGVLLLASVTWSALAAPSIQQPIEGTRILEAEELFEGDILLPESLSEDRAAVPQAAKLWPKGVITYAIHKSLAKEVKLIRSAMASIEAVSCLRFVNRTKEEPDYVLIYRGSLCASMIGRQGGRQELSLGTDCLGKSTIAHELLHAAGFFHEHSRSDRDQYLDIFPENVAQGKMRNFDKLQSDENRLLTAFDTQSVMLYGSTSFARAPGLVTMLTKDGKRLPEVYQKKGLSASDAHRIRILYKCRK
ncbi:astacin-like metalloprotease toxin 5 [Amblyomma americanum]